jgi:hypothetical protein
MFDQEVVLKMASSQLVEVNLSQASLLQAPIHYLRVGSFSGREN